MLLKPPHILKQIQQVAWDLRLCWISKAAPHGVNFIMICQWSRLRWWKSSILVLFLWVVKEKLVHATTSANTHNEKHWKRIFTTENNCPIWWLLSLSTRDLLFLMPIIPQFLPPPILYFSKAVSLHSKKVVCFFFF